MTLREITNLIQESNLLFKVNIADGKKYGKQTLSNVNQHYGSISDYLKKIAGHTPLKNVLITLYRKNGSSFKKKETYKLNLESSNAEVLNGMAQNDNTIVSNFIGNKSNFSNNNNLSNGQQSNNVSSVPVETKTSYYKNNGYNKSNFSNNKSNFSNNKKTENRFLNPHKNHNQMATKTDIELAQLKAETKYLQEKVTELQNRNKFLERKNDEYHAENLSLLRENATEKDKRNLEFKQKELELLAKQKQGLSGAFEDIKTLPPEAWQFVAGLLPNHPMSKGLLPANSTPVQNNTPLSGGSKHPDTDAQACMEVIDTLLIKQTPEIVGMSAMLIEHLITHPTILRTVYEKFFPETTGQTTTTSSNNDSNKK